MWINLFDYQLDAIKRMKNGCILCGDVGSGKSRTSLAYYYIQCGGNLDDQFQEMSSPKDLYIITTARKRDTLEWEGELVPFLLSSDPKLNYHKNKIVIDSWNNIRKYVDVTDAFFIFDEQRVVGSGAWVKSFLKIVKSNQWVLLSATPGDTWQDYIPVFVANGFYKNRTEFTRNHIIYKSYLNFPQIDRYVNTGRLLKLRESILIDMNYKINAILTHTDVFVNYDILKYKEVIRKRWNYITNSPIENASEFCYLLRRVVNEDQSRQLAVLELCETHPKLIIFYNFDYELEILRNLGYGTDVKVAEWNGHKHEPLPKSEKWVYLVQYTAGSEGWNCIETDTIIFYSQNYSYKTMMQACGRINRLNSPFKELHYYHIKTRSGIDLAISKALSNKKQFNERKFYEKR